MPLVLPDGARIPREAPAIEKWLPNGDSPWATVQLSLFWNLQKSPGAAPSRPASGRGRSPLVIEAIASARSLRTQIEVRTRRAVPASVATLEGRSARRRAPRG